MNNNAKRNDGSIEQTSSEVTIEATQSTDTESSSQEATKLRLTISPFERQRPPKAYRKLKDMIHDKELCWSFTPREYESNLIRAEHTEEVTAKELAEAISKGRTWSGATFIDNDPVFYAYKHVHNNIRCLESYDKKRPMPIHPGRRANHNFEQAQVVAVEIEDAIHTLDNYIHSFKRLNLEPTFIISSFGDNEEIAGRIIRKFVCVWILDQPITSTVEYSNLLNSLVLITNGKVQAQTIQADRMWLGGTSILHENYNQVITAFDIDKALTKSKKPKRVMTGV